MNAENRKRMLEVLRADALPRSEEQARWMVEGLWGQQAVGMLAGHPKSCKSWLGLDVALSVASATPCLGRFPVREPATVLIYLAEDALAQVRQRLEGMCAHRGLRLNDLSLWVIAADSLRLDRDDDRLRLEQAVRQVRPALLLLDPLVRLHQCDENDAMAIAALLSWLRALQRQYALAVMLVHHARKNGGSGGLALRGSSDLWAWGDSNLYLKRSYGKLMLNIEQRCARAPEPVALRLVDDNPDRVHLEVSDEKARPSEDVAAQALRSRIREILQQGPVTRTALRGALGIKNERLGTLLEQMAAEGQICRTAKGWRLAVEQKDRTQASVTAGNEEAVVSGQEAPAGCSLFPL